MGREFEVLPVPFLNCAHRVCACVPLCARVCGGLAWGAEPWRRGVASPLTRIIWGGALSAWGALHSPSWVWLTFLRLIGFLWHRDPSFAGGKGSPAGLKLSKDPQARLWMEERKTFPARGPWWPAGVEGQEAGALQGQRRGTLTGVQAPPPAGPGPLTPASRSPQTDGLRLCPETETPSGRIYQGLLEFAR